jgi:hypothetical protein
MPFFFLPPDPEQRRGRGGLGRRRAAAPQGSAAAGGRGNGGGIEGISTPCLPWAGIACGGSSAASGGGQLWWLGWWCLEAWEVGRFGWGGARRGGEPRRALYRRGKVGSGEIFPAGKLTGGGGVPAGPRWPARIPVAGRRDGSGGGQLRRLRSSGGSRQVPSGTRCQTARGGRPAGPGRCRIAGGDSAVV